MKSPKTFRSKNGATLEFSRFEVYMQPTFRDYLNMGWRTSVIGAIDFTASNGIQDKHDSLHYFGKFGHN